MTAKSLRKVQKRIVKKKGSSAPALHQNSRDSRRLHTAIARHDKLALVAAARGKQTQPFLDRVTFFQSKADSLGDQQDDQSATLSDVHEFIQQYINRHDEELQALQAARRPGRPSTARQDALTQKRDRNLQEYESGFWLPDLTEYNAVAALKRWDGAWQSLNTVGFCRISRDGRKRAAAFPPNHDN